jgi:hypothetical protein
MRRGSKSYGALGNTFGTGSEGCLVEWLVKLVVAAVAVTLIMR